MKLPLGHARIAPYAEYIQKPAAIENSTGSGMVARFLGTSSLLLQDADTAVLSDGFVTRPGLSRVIAGKIEPNEETVTATIDRLKLTSLSAVFCCHSHYDHALDAPVWAHRFGADLIGSASTANIGRGWGLAESKLEVVGDGDTLSYGEFQLEFIESVHSPGDHYPGVINAPLVPPAKAGAWKTGLAYSVLVTHRDRTLLIHASANYRPGALRDRRAEVVYLGIGTLGKQPDAFADQYWDEVVRATGARRVILIHWDDLFRSLDKPPRSMPYAMDDFDRGMRQILTRAQADNVEVLLPPPWHPTTPFPPDTP